MVSLKNCISEYKKQLEKLEAQLIKYCSSEFLYNTLLVSLVTHNSQERYIQIAEFFLLFEHIRNFSMDSLCPFMHAN